MGNDRECSVGSNLPAGTVECQGSPQKENPMTQTGFELRTSRLKTLNVVETENDGLVGSTVLAPQEPGGPTMALLVVGS